MPTEAGKSKRVRCPYSIPPVNPPDEATIKQLPSATILFFLKIEALLRSEKVWGLYRKDRKKTGNKLRQVYGAISWATLQGAHHMLLEPESQNGGKFFAPDFPHVLLGDDPVTELKDTIQSVDGLYHGWFLNLNPGEPTPLSFLSDLLEKDPVNRHKLHLVINTAHSVAKTVAELEKRIRAQRRSLSKDERDASTRWRLAKPLDLLVWLKYIQCYDLHHVHSLGYGSIGTQVYGDGNAQERAQRRDKAKKAVRSVSRLIKAAETHNWPPLTLS